MHHPECTAFEEVTRRVVEFVPQNQPNQAMRRVALGLAIIASITTIAAGSVRIHSDLAMSQRLDTLIQAIPKQPAENPVPNTHG
jgi:hypothetical protein